MNLADMNYIEILKNNSIIDKECIKKLEGKLIKKDNEIIRLNKQIAQLETMYDEKLKEVLELRKKLEG